MDCFCMPIVVTYCKNTVGIVLYISGSCNSAGNSIFVTFLFLIYYNNETAYGVKMEKITYKIILRKDFLIRKISKNVFSIILLTKRSILSVKMLKFYVKPKRIKLLNN